MSCSKGPRGTRGNGGISDGPKQCYLKTLGIRQVVPKNSAISKNNLSKKIGKLSFTFGKLAFSGQTVPKPKAKYQGHYNPATEVLQDFQVSLRLRNTQKESVNIIDSNFGVDD